MWNRLRRQRGRAEEPPVDPNSVTEEGWLEAVRERLRANANDADGLEALGVWYLACGEPARALECFHEVTRQDSHYPGIWRLKAQAFAVIGDADNAARCRRRGLDPDS